MVHQVPDSSSRLPPACQPRRQFGNHDRGTLESRQAGFDQDVDQESLRAALQWRVGETVVEVHIFPVLKLDDEVSVGETAPWSAINLRRLRGALGWFPHPGLRGRLRK